MHSVATTVLRKPRSRSSVGILDEYVDAIVPYDDITQVAVNVHKAFWGVLLRRSETWASAIATGTSQMVMITTRMTTAVAKCG